MARTIFTPDNDNNDGVTHGTENEASVTQVDEFLAEDHDGASGDFEVLSSATSDDDTISDDSDEESEEEEDEDQKKRAPIDLNKTIYVVFDLETNGLSHVRNHIIEIAATVLNHRGEPVEDGLFSSLINPLAPIPYLVTQITTITNAQVANQPLFATVANDFVRFIFQRVKDWEEKEKSTVSNIVLVAHNGYKFDVPFLMRKYLQGHVSAINTIIRKLYALDTMVLAKQVVKKKQMRIPDNYKLKCVYNYCTRKKMKNAHRADVDVEATVSILQYRPFWTERERFIYKVNEDGSVNRPKNLRRREIEDDSDTDHESDEDSVDDSVSEAEEEEEEEEEQVVGWTMNTTFEGVKSSELFEQNLQSRSVRRRNNDENISPGLQYSPNTVNSPMKAWRAIFTFFIIDKIVGYTNDYGKEKVNSWSDIDRKDFTDFISILFISAIQKRKDKISNWWSDDPLLENVVAKRIMTGRHFHQMLRFLHCCPINDPTRNNNVYDPAYKIKEIMDLLESRYKKLFIPGENLSLDESLIRAFGRIKFKVRIITKAARYGIKLYVLTDAETAFVLKVIIYTGAQTYGTTDEEVSKTVHVVRNLAENYRGTYRTIYIDRFYTSLDLMKEMDKLNLFVTGTVMANRIPKELKINKTSTEFKSMIRGDYKKHRYSYVDDLGIQRHYGLVAWKDSNMVYLLSSNHDTNSVDQCYRRSSEGRIMVNRPSVIGKYNCNMGGVDLADMRRLHCNSTLMGQNRWWLKLFFYNLDVATSNALILYNLATNSKMTIVEFKMKLIMGFVGKQIENIGRNPTSFAHRMEKVKNRYRCVYCAMLQDNKNRRTIHVCSAEGCHLPLCTTGHGRTNRNCFEIVHADDNLLEACQIRHREMMKNCTKNATKPPNSESK